MDQVTVITCTHNPRSDYLAETIEALARQSLPLDRWEYLLIDNASSPERTPKVELSWHPEARMIREENLGLTPARLRGIREAQGNLLIFVDDDNVLDPNFLEQALRVAEEKPFLGSWSGQTALVAGHEIQPGT
jgi:glycosyltransferase involved in cell wall biosynthesis